MFVSDCFVFLHVPKTGGTFVQKILARHLPMEQVNGRHSSYRDLSEEQRALPVLCIVRNPWDWYVSWYHHNLAVGGEKSESWSKRVIWEDLLASGQADFRSATARACRGGFRHPLAAMMEDEGLDLYSALFKSIVGEALDHPRLTVLRFESLRAELLRFLVEHVEVSAALRRGVLFQRPRRTSEHGPYAGYYDDELRQLVGEKTTWLRSSYPYEFEPAPGAPEPRSDGDALEHPEGERLVDGERPQQPRTDHLVET
jgi:hypothetical protein